MNVSGLHMFMDEDIVYMDYELLIRLKKSGLGCYIGHIFVGAFGYADDVSLLSPTGKSINLMSRIAWQYGTDRAVIFNPTKSKFVALEIMVKLMAQLYLVKQY